MKKKKPTEKFLATRKKAASKIVFKKIEEKLHM